jgi:hypothetical protein
LRCVFAASGTAEQKRESSITLDGIRILMSILFTLLFIALLCWVIYWGEQEPKITDSFLLKHGCHKLYLIELLLLVILIWNNYRNRDEMGECLQLIDRYDKMCQVRWEEAKVFVDDSGLLRDA